MDEFIASLPKAELHLHLEGSVEAEALRQLAERHGSPLAAQMAENGAPLYATRNFADFLQAFKTVCQHLHSPEDYEFITYDLLRRLARQNVRYAEITLSAGVILWKGESVAGAFEGVHAATLRAKKDFGIRVAWIFDAVRQFGPEAAMEVARQSAPLLDRGVVAFGLGGDEKQAAPELFREAFAFARSRGLRATVHAGETMGPESVWGALRSLGADRIGHGLTVAQDSRLMDYLAEKRIPVEVCLTSNLRTGGVEELARHPLRLYFDRGIPVSLNTDDPALFGTTLNREYLLARETFHFTNQELVEIAKSSFRAAYLAGDEKDCYLAEFDRLI